MDGKCWKLTERMTDYPIHIVKQGKYVHPFQDHCPFFSIFCIFPNFIIPLMAVFPSPFTISGFLFCDVGVQPVIKNSAHPVCALFFLIWP